MDFNLRINKISLQPGAKIETRILKDSEFRKVGLVERLLKRLPKGQSLFIADNCTVECFADQMNLYPCTDGYLNKDRQWQTRAFVYLVEDENKKVEFHVLEGVYAAPNFTHRFRNICSENFGTPEEMPTNHFHWKNEHFSLSSILHTDNINADFSIEVLE